MIVFNVSALVLCFMFSYSNAAETFWTTTDELENHISPDDLREFLNLSKNNSATDNNTTGSLDYADVEDVSLRLPVPGFVDCFGLGALTRRLPWLFDMRPSSSEDVNTHFYYSSRRQRERLQVFGGEQFGLEHTDFDPARKTVMVIHGFMSHSNASWVKDMTRAYLEWDDVNVFAVDWSGGGNTWRYWRAVANTRRVGSDVTGFMKQLVSETEAKVKNFHFIGHSLGAHISSYVSFHLGGVGRITGLDPAQPCFRTSDLTERLDDSDADFVDVIHTNGRLLTKIGFGMPEPIGHADFYPNGGMRQPGCNYQRDSLWSKLFPKTLTKIQQAICSHGRSYLLFTESLKNKNCSFTAYKWNLTYEGVNASLKAACDRQSSCSVMGIMAEGNDTAARGLQRARGSYFVLTSERQPYCPTETARGGILSELLRDLLEGFRLNWAKNTTTAKVPAYADPDESEEDDDTPATTTKRSWFSRWLG